MWKEPSLCVIQNIYETQHALHCTSHENPHATSSQFTGFFCPFFVSYFVLAMGLLTRADTKCSKQGNVLLNSSFLSRRNVEKAERHFLAVCVWCLKSCELTRIISVTLKALQTNKQLNSDKWGYYHWQTYFVRNLWCKRYSKSALLGPLHLFSLSHSLLKISITLFVGGRCMS